MVVQVANIHTHNANCSWRTEVNGCVFACVCVLICFVSVITPKVHQEEKPLGRERKGFRKEGKMLTQVKETDL